LEDIAELLTLSVPAVKAALHRGRGHLAKLRAAPPLEARAPFSPTLVRYAMLFNARDWDGVRAMLAQHIRLDVKDRLQRVGRSEVEQYFTNYSQMTAQWRLAPAWLDGRQVLAAFLDGSDAKPRYFIEVGVKGDRIASIRDYFHVPYIVA